MQKSRKVDDNGFIVLGEKHNHVNCSNGYNKNCDRKVRILEPGELIEVQYS